MSLDRFTALLVAKFLLCVLCVQFPLVSLIAVHVFPLQRDFIATLSRAPHLFTRLQRVYFFSLSIFVLILILLVRVVIVPGFLVVPRVASHVVLVASVGGRTAVSSYLSIVGPVGGMHVSRRTHPSILGSLEQNI